MNRPDIQGIFSRVRRMLAPGGRRFIPLTHAEWTGLCRRAGFNFLTSTPTSDGLGRKTFAWLNCLAVTDRKK